MTRTEWLFGYPPEEYANNLEPLALKRIKHAKALIKKLLKWKTYDPEKKTVFTINNDLRMNESLEALKLWTKILEDGKN